jgi:ribosomal protein L40E
MEEQREAPPMSCPACQALNAPAARWCSNCGAPLAVSAPAAASGARGVPVPATAPTVPEPAASGAAQADTGDGPVRAAASTVRQARQCQWCGAANAADAEQCQQCGAMFPRPEQDEALLRAAEERLRAANDTLDMMRRRRGKRGFGRFIDT